MPSLKTTRSGFDGGMTCSEAAVKGTRREKSRHTECDSTRGRCSAEDTEHGPQRAAVEPGVWGRRGAFTQNVEALRRCGVPNTFGAPCLCAERAVSSEAETQPTQHRTCSPSSVASLVPCGCKRHPSYKEDIFSFRTASSLPLQNGIGEFEMYRQVTNLVTPWAGLCISVHGLAHSPLCEWRTLFSHSWHTSSAFVQTPDSSYRDWESGTQREIFLKF